MLLCPESHQCRKVSCLTPKLPDFALNLSRIGMERGEGAPQQAEGLAKGSTATTGMLRDWCWWQGKGMLRKSSLPDKDQAGSKTV